MRGDRQEEALGRSLLYAFGSSQGVWLQKHSLSSINVKSRGLWPQGRAAEGQGAEVSAFPVSHFSLLHLSGLATSGQRQGPACLVAH